MAKGIKVCKICGREYEACHTLRPNLDNEFRWNDVCCCPEHGAEYLRRVLIARGQLQESEDTGQAREEDAGKKPAKKARARKAAE